jgi:hypothetical protein
MVLLSVQIVGPDGYLSRDSASVAVQRSEFDPEWVRFSFRAPASFGWRAHLAEAREPGASVAQVWSWRGGAEPEVVGRDASAIETSQPGPGGWTESRQVQDRWAEATRMQAARVGVAAGMMTRRLGEGALPRLAPGHRAPEAWLGGRLRNARARQGSSLQVLLGDNRPGRTDGAARRGRGSGGQRSFHEVSELPNGSIWLRATPPPRWLISPRTEPTRWPARWHRS